jgi:site-specific DNA recombinase
MAKLRKPIDVKNPKNGHKIGFYVRVSTEEQAENPEGSIKNQEERLKQAVRQKNEDGKFGDVVGIFIDRGISAKDTKRPELQRLLEAIGNREITLVMVTELSRLSRNMRDFAEMWELMQACGCRFQSLRESWDTTTAAGEMILYNMANFAQYERRQTAERVKANLNARAQRGLYNGGPIPIGYKLIPDKAGFLAIDPEGAEVVRRAFDLFLEKGSLTEAACALNEMGYTLKRHKQGGGGKPRLGHFTINNLHDILRNKTYAGIKTYEDRGEMKDAQAVWPAIIDLDKFNRVSQRLTQNHSRHKPDHFKTYPYEITGFTVCSQCGCAMIGKSAWGGAGKIAYYEHSWLTKRDACIVKKAFKCDPYRVQAKIVESLVWQKMQEVLSNPKMACELIESAHAQHREASKVVSLDKIRVRINELGQQLDVLAERLSELPKSISPTPIYKQMEKLELKRADEQAKLGKAQKENSNFALPVELDSYNEFLAGLSQLSRSSLAPDRARITRCLVQKIEIGPTFVRIHFRVAKLSIKAELDDIMHKYETVKSVIEPKGKSSAAADYFFSSNSSGTLTNGAPTRMSEENFLLH